MLSCSPLSHNSAVFNSRKSDIFPGYLGSHESSEINLNIAVRIGVVLFEIQICLVIQQAVQNERGVAVCTLDRHGIVRRVVIGEEGVKLQREVPDPGAISALQHPARQRKALTITG